MSKGGARIGTHNGAFHADEVFAVMMLTNFVEEYRGAEVVRTRDPKLLQAMDVVVDVGAVYDPAHLRFDHHQNSFSDTFSAQFSTKLSSCGLVYRHFGARLLPVALAEALAAGTVVSAQGAEPRAALGEEFLVDFYRYFVEHIDAVDNGVSQYPADAKPRYAMPPTHVMGRIGRLNEAWWETAGAPAAARFAQAMAVAKEEFLDSLKFLYFSWYHTVPALKQAVLDAEKTHASGRIIALPRASSWKQALFKVEEELGVVGRLLFVVYSDAASGTFRVQAVPESPTAFASRQPLRAEWRGLREAELAAAAGIPDAIFCHPTGFIGGAKSLASAVRMAAQCLPAKP